MTPRARNPEEAALAAEIRESYRAGASLAHMARELGLSVDQVRRLRDIPEEKQ
jgi:ribosomal protein L13E